MQPGQMRRMGSAFTGLKCMFSEGSETAGGGRNARAAMHGCRPGTHCWRFHNSDLILGEFQEKHVETLLLSISAQWGEQCFHFNTSMKIVN